MSNLTKNMINKDLRMIGRVMSLMARPSVRGLRFLHRTLTLAKVNNVEWADLETVQIPRSEGDGAIRTLVFRPKTQTKPVPILIFLHGGGYAIGVPEQSVSSIKNFMETRDCVAIVPDYRLSMEHPYPAGLNDCYDTLLWAHENADSLGGRQDQIFVGGDSAGGGLTVATCLMARDKGEVKIAFQMPIYPMIDDSQSRPSAINNTMPVWSSKHNKVAWDLYLSNLVAEGKEIPTYAAPMRAKSFAGLPPAATFVGQLDPFLDETVAYVEALRTEGIPVQFETYAGSYHGFDAVAPTSQTGQQAIQFIKDAFAHAVDNYST